MFALKVFWIDVNLLEVRTVQYSKMHKYNVLEKNRSD